MKKHQYMALVAVILAVAVLLDYPTWLLIFSFVFGIGSFFVKD